MRVRVKVRVGVRVRAGVRMRKCKSVGEWRGGWTVYNESKKNLMRKMDYTAVIIRLTCHNFRLKVDMRIYFLLCMLLDDYTAHTPGQLPLR